MELNESPPRYKEFYGPYAEQMPRLLREGRTPMTVADVMRRRVEVARSATDVRAAWLDHYLHTSDAILYDTSGRLKIVRAAGLLTAVTPQCAIRDGALTIDAAVYDAVAAPEFAASDLVTGMPLSAHDVRCNPVWLALAGEDRALLDEYVTMVFKNARRLFAYTEAMGVYLPPPSTTPCVGIWIVNCVEKAAGVHATLELDNPYSRLVGVAPATRD